MKRQRWTVYARTTCRLGVSDRMSHDLCRDLIKVFNKYKLRGWSVGRDPAKGKLK
jgi:hypothetical protein